jgi:hypothetical protein
MKLRTITSPSGARFTVDEAYADKFSSFLAELEGRGYAVDGGQSGGYNPRNIRGTSTPSNHAFGRAIDINWSDNPQGGAGKIPAETARELAAKYGMRWGGDYKNAKPDPMHFEFVGGEPVPVQNRSLTAFAGNASPKAPEADFTSTPKPETADMTYGPVPAAPQGAFGNMQAKFAASPMGTLASGLKRGDSTDIQAGLGGVASGAFGALGQAFGGGNGGDDAQGQASAALAKSANEANAAALSGQDQAQAQIIQAMLARHQQPRGAFA